MAEARRRKRSSDNLLSREVGEVFSGSTIKDSVFKLLDKNPLLTAKPLCKLSSLPWPKYQSYINNLRSRWLNSPKNERGSKCSIHGWRGWCFVPGDVNGGIRCRGVEVGWRETRSRNRWLLWKDRLGRLQWFETGRVNLYVRKPASLGKAYQIVCNGFSFTGLITDLKVLEGVLGSVRFKGAHYVFSVGQRLPRLTIDLFRKSNGVVIKVGDRSHPDSVEVIASYPDWAERNERLLEQLNDVLRRSIGSAALNNVKGKVDYVA